MDYSRNKQNEHLGVNKMGKSIKKSPLHQPNFGSILSTQPPPQPRPQVYNINKNDFRNIVQQLTGSSSQELSCRPPQNLVKQQSLRLQRIRPPPLTPINCPRVPPPVPVSMPSMPQVPYNNAQFRSSAMFQGQPADSIGPKTADSPISAYMRYLQSSAIDSPAMGNQVQPLPQAQAQNRAVATAPSSTNGPDPSVYLNLLSPQSPHPFLSPGIRFPPPLSPNFLFSPMAQPWILGPGPHPPPLSPGLVFPLSPSGLFPLLSPRWRDW